MDSAAGQLIAAPDIEYNDEVVDTAGHSLRYFGKDEHNTGMVFQPMSIYPSLYMILCPSDTTQVQIKDNAKLASSQPKPDAGVLRASMPNKDNQVA